MSSVGTDGALVVSPAGCPIHGTKRHGWSRIRHNQAAGVIDPTAFDHSITGKIAKVVAASAPEGEADSKFTDKAPAHIVEGLRKQTDEARILRDKAEAALDALPPA